MNSKSMKYVEVDFNNMDDDDDDDGDTKQCL